MTFRIGECSSCGANYKLPASFEADQARCKNCGGTVQIGKAGEPGPSKTAPPVPATKPSDSAAAAGSSGPVEVTRAKKKKDGPSMKERLQAQRQAEAQAAAKSAAKPAAKPAAKAAPKPAAKTAAKPVAVSKPGAAAAKPSSSRRARPAGARGSSSRRGGDSDAEGGSSSRRSGGGRRRGASSKPEKKAPIGGIIALVAILIGGGGGAWWYMGQDDTPENPVNAAGNTETDVAMSDTTGENSDEGATGDEGAVDDETAGTEDAASDEGGEAAGEAADTEAAAAKPVKKAAAKGDPDSVDLTAIPDYGPIAGCDEARFAELQELAATMIDPEAGAAGNRARNKLVEAGKEAFPVILNAMKTLDLTEEGSFRSADVCQKALQDLCNGNNFGWKYPSQEPDDFHYFDKKVIVSWSKAWDQAKDNDGAWAKLAKLDKIEKTDEEGEEDEETEDALDALDDF